MTKITDHDPLCPGRDLPREFHQCRCDLIARVRADEQAKADLAISIWEQEYENERRRSEEERERLRAQVEVLPTWDGYYAPCVVLADVLALLEVSE